MQAAEYMGDLVSGPAPKRHPFPPPIPIHPSKKHYLKAGSESGSKNPGRTKPAIEIKRPKPLIPVVDVPAVRTDSPEYAYKSFRFRASDLMQANRGTDPKDFYRKHWSELHSIARGAARDAGIAFADLVAFIRDNTGKFATAGKPHFSLVGLSEEDHRAPEPVDPLEVLPREPNEATPGDAYPTGPAVEVVPDVDTRPVVDPERIGGALLGAAVREYRALVLEPGNDAGAVASLVAARYGMAAKDLARHLEELEAAEKPAETASERIAGASQGPREPSRREKVKAAFAELYRGFAEAEQAGGSPDPEQAILEVAGRHKVPAAELARYIQTEAVEDPDLEAA